MLKSVWFFILSPILKIIAIESGFVRDHIALKELISFFNFIVIIIKITDLKFHGN